MQGVKKWPFQNSPRSNALLPSNVRLLPVVNALQ